MIQELNALDFIGEMSQATGVKIAVGLNAYIEESNPFYLYTITIDPSSMSDEDESKLEEYSNKQGLRMGESWNDWGRFLTISNMRLVFASAFSPEPRPTWQRYCRIKVGGDARVRQ
jgi:hypothetical protein